jgi:hypothetical protein
VPVIFAAKSRDVGGDNVVFVWKKKTSDKHEKPKDKRKQSTFAAMLTVIFQVMMFTAAAAFLHQNFREPIRMSIHEYVVKENLFAL